MMRLTETSRSQEHGRRMQPCVQAFLGLPARLHRLHAVPMSLRSLPLPAPARAVIWDRHRHLTRCALLICVRRSSRDNRNVCLELPKRLPIASSTGRLRPLGALSEPVTLPEYDAQEQAQRVRLQLFVSPESCRSTIYPRIEWWACACRGHMLPRLDNLLHRECLMPSKPSIREAATCSTSDSERSMFQSPRIRSRASHGQALSSMLHHSILNFGCC